MGHEDHDAEWAELDDADISNYREKRVAELKKAYVHSVSTGHMGNGD